MHTPLPWNYRPAKNVVNGPKPIFGVFDLPAEVTNTSDEAKIKFGGITVEGDANAELVVRAVNSHAELVDVARKVLERCEGDIELWHHAQLALTLATISQEDLAS